MQNEHIICTLPELIYPLLRYGTCTGVLKTHYKYPQAEDNWGVQSRSRTPDFPISLQELGQSHAWGPVRHSRLGLWTTLLNLSGASWSFSLLYTAEMSLEQKPSFNLEFNKNWLSIAEHKQSCFTNLPGLFVLGRKQVLSAEADDRCWLKDKYYLYFSTRFLLMHILSCMGIWSTKKLFDISQARLRALSLHGNGFKEFIQAQSPIKARWRRRKVLKEK